MPPLSIGTYVDVALVSTVVALMLYPWAGRPAYLAYRTPVFVTGVVFMPLFLYIGSVLSSNIQSLSTQATLLLVGLGLFWLSAAVLALPQTQGEYVPGLGFRPDLILPGGVNLVKGVILTGLGLMLAFQPEFQLPAWNWWGFALAFWGIILTIPVRGMLKMLMRRGRLLGEPWATSWWAIALREGALFVGLGILMYGLLNAFMGAIPFTTIYPKLWVTWSFVGGAFALLVLVRPLLKAMILEGDERWWETITKQLLLYVSFVGMIYGLASSFMDQWLWFHPDSNPAGFAMGISLVGAGFLLAVPLRAAALRNEWKATVRIVTGRVCDLEEPRRREFVSRRVAVLAAQLEEQRRGNMRRMLDGLVRAGEARRLRFLESMVSVLAELPAESRELLMRSNAACLGELPEDARREVMKAMMTSVSGLPEDQRQPVMETMAGLVSA
ncbi:MAG: hypothetical protein HYU54_02690 [Actinobacteria bacterium]|nr:hypothetical protein [Actinomycetota bacterium]